MTTVLQFSGGKDSLACLHLLRPRWNEITVVWVNTGAAFPETVEQMGEIRKLVPHFMEIRSKQTIATHGYPADVVPLDAGFQSRYACCYEALWKPTRDAMNAMGAKVIIRGQKRCDALKSIVKDGDVIEGVEYRFPLYEWSDEDVLAYLRELGVNLPANYSYMKTGLDCWNCTAYLAENDGKLEYLRDHHPEWHQHVRSKLQELSDQIDSKNEPLRRNL